MVVAPLDLASKPSDHHHLPPPPVVFPPGWREKEEDKPFLKNSDFEYPKVLPDLSSLDIYTNYANIKKLTRMQKVRWPEFSWQSKQVDESSRVFTQFAKDVSRIGYDDKGQVWAIICPQLGRYTKYWGSLNIETTVTGVRGYMDEPKKTGAVDMSVIAKFWLSTNEPQPKFVQAIEKLMSIFTTLPMTKEKAIKIKTNEMNNPSEKTFRVASGMDKVSTPSFTQHWGEAFAVYYLSVQIGAVETHSTDSELVTDFNQLLVDILNISRYNMFQEYNILSWNLWVSAPELVDREEWKAHAEKWRKSLNKDGTVPGREQPRGDPQYITGKPANRLLNLDYDAAEIDRIKEFFKKHRIQLGVNALKKRAEHNAHQAKKDQSSEQTQDDDLKDTFTQSDFDTLKEFMYDEIEDTIS